MNSTSQIRAGFVGLIGQPNAGKSTLLNSFVKEKVSIVSHKPQTTRRRILGIVNAKEYQIVFVDAPGVIEAQKGLNHFLSQEADDVIEQSDALVAVLSIDTKSEKEIDQILEKVVASKKPWVAVVNKVDLAEVTRRIQMIKDKISDLKNCHGVFEYSETWGKDLKDINANIFKTLAEVLPESPGPLYDIDLFTPHTMRELVAEIVREKCFTVLEQELPYMLATQVIKYDEDERIPHIYCDIFVAKESHRAMTIGKGGEVIKKIGMLSRAEIEKLVGGKVFLKLDVKVKEDWMNSNKFMKELGYVVERE